MSARTQNQDDTVAADAERWLARLHSPDCTAEERMNFERWRSADASHEAAYASVEGMWGQVGKLAGDPLIAAALAKAQRPAPRPYLTPLRLAASLAAVALLGLAIYRLTDDPNQYHTALGEQQRLRLADGSAVTLDTATAIRVEFNAQVRRVYLDQGRAHFSVARDSDRPFSVIACDSVITALGTVFDVQNEGGDVTVTLVQGKVQVVPQPKVPREVLQPGERITVSGLSRIERAASVDVAAASAWAQGNLIFKAVALEDAIAEVNRYTPRKIRIADASLAAMPISGVFHVGDPEAAVIALEKSFPIKASRASDGATLLTRQPSTSGP